MRRRMDNGRIKAIGMQDEKNIKYVVLNDYN